MNTAIKRVEKFFWWINERHEIYLKRKRGEEPPWTDDKILRKYKFTNVYRELDRETVNLHSAIDKLPLVLGPDRLFHIIAYRAFNILSTYQALTRGASTLGNAKKMKKVLHRREDQGLRIFTGAYIITNAGQSASKIDLMCDALAVQWRGRVKIWNEMGQDGTMQGCTKILSQYPMQGPFTSYEVICDLRHQKGSFLAKAPDLRKWANLGPGARRGINRIVSGKKKPNVFKSTDEYVLFMSELLKSAPGYLSDGVKKERLPFEMREIEHSLCEFDKWVRATNGEGRPRSVFRGGE